MTQFVIEVSVEPECTLVRGNVMDSGDVAFDRECEEKVLQELTRGNVWAWCCITVTVSFGELSVSDSLGCCSYESRADFLLNSMYYEGMVAECKQRLREQATNLLNAQ